MATEIERKFLVAKDGWRGGATSIQIRQGYISSVPQRTVRVRVADARAFLTIKGETRGLARQEFEYEIPLADGEQLLNLCGDALIEKTRYAVDYRGTRWEVDEFHGANEGLVLAEIELPSESEPVDVPSWLGIEVSSDMCYANSNLASYPRSKWQA